MAKNIKEQISEEINTADVPFYCIMVDGTRDRNNAEAISIVLRYIKNDIPKESLLSIEEAVSLKTEYLSELILQVLRENTINCEHMLVL